MKNILVVDDNKDVAGLFKRILELKGYNCIATTKGEEGFRLITENNFDLLVLDIAMPDMTGVDILKKIKSDPKLSHNKIVFITASSPPDETIESLKEQGALEIIKKPISKKHLIDIVSKYV